MATTMNGNDSAIRAMQQILQEHLLTEPVFAAKLANPQRSIEKAIAFVCNSVKEMGVCVLDDTTVKNLLLHYYDGDVEEDSIKPINCNIVVSKPELTDEDKAELREQAMKEYKEEQLRAISRENQPKPQAKASANNAKAQEINVEPNLFGEDF